MRTKIKPARLNRGDTIGILAPCYALDRENITPALRCIEQQGFKIKLSDNAFSVSWGYSGSVEERVHDFHQMISDPEIKMLLFAGGEVCNQLLPYLDFDSIRSNPKIICSYSDSTTLLDAITNLTGLVTFYGGSLRQFFNLSEYNRVTFEMRLMSDSTEYIKNSDWRVIHPGRCKGVLTGGYLVNYADLIGTEYYREAPDGCLLFLEDHEMFNAPAAVDRWITTLIQHGVLERAVGLIFGNYSEDNTPLIDRILYRVGERFDIPVIRCDDFGHGANKALLPIGIEAALDTEKSSFEFLESGVL